MRKLMKTLPPSPYFSGFPPGGKVWIFRSCRIKFQNCYPIQNFTLINFALHDQFNIPDSSRKDMRVLKWRSSLLHYHVPPIQQLLIRISLKSLGICNWPLRDDSAFRALPSLRSLRGAPEVPPLCQETSVSRTANVGTVGQNGLSAG